MEDDSLMDEALLKLLAHHNKLGWNPASTIAQYREVKLFLRQFDIVPGNAAVPADLIYYKYHRSKNGDLIGRQRFTRIIKLLMPWINSGQKAIFKLDPTKLDLPETYSYYKDPRFHALRPRKTKYVGVRPAPYNEWIAEIEVDGQMELVGYFPTSRQAARAWNEAAIYFYGVGAPQNKIYETKAEKATRSTKRKTKEKR